MCVCVCVSTGWLTHIPGNQRGDPISSKAPDRFSPLITDTHTGALWREKRRTHTATCLTNALPAHINYPDTRHCACPTPLFTTLGLWASLDGMKAHDTMTHTQYIQWLPASQPKPTGHNISFPIQTLDLREQSPSIPPPTLFSIPTVFPFSALEAHPSQSVHFTHFKSTHRAIREFQGISGKTQLLASSYTQSTDSHGDKQTHGVLRHTHQQAKIK